MNLCLNVWTSCLHVCVQATSTVCMFVSNEALYLASIHACVTSAGLPVWMCTYTKNGTQTCYLTCTLCLGMRINQHRLWHQSNRSNLGTFNGVTRCTHRLHHKDLQLENKLKCIHGKHKMNTQRETPANIKDYQGLDGFLIIKLAAWLVIHLGIIWIPETGR